MKIILYTSDAKQLDLDIKNKIKQEESLKTWKVETDNKNSTIYFHSTKTHQWENDLYVQPCIIENDNSKLLFRITEKEGTPLAFDPVFGYLMGRFIQILIVHFSEYYSRIEIK